MKILIILGLILGVYLLHRLCLWLEKNGHLYYLNKKPERGLIGSAMEEINGILHPGVRQTIEMKRNETKFVKKSLKEGGSNNELGDVGN